MNFLNIKSDFRLMQNKTEKICLGVISIMVFVFIMALANSYMTNLLLKSEPAAMSGKITIEFAPVQNSIDGILTDKERGAVLSLLKKTDGIKSTKIIPLAEMKAMFSKFVPGIELPKNIPFPTIVEANIGSGNNIDIQKLSKDLSTINPNVRIYNYEKLSGFANKLSFMFKFVSIFMSLLALIAIGVTIYHLIINGASMNEKTLKMLRSFGASNKYIFEQFKNAYTVFGLKAAAIASILSIISFVSLYVIFDVANIWLYLAICTCFVIIIPVMILSLMFIISNVVASKSLSNY